MSPCRGSTKSTLRLILSLLGALLGGPVFAQQAHDGVPPDPPPRRQPSWGDGPALAQPLDTEVPVRPPTPEPVWESASAYLQPENLPRASLVLTGSLPRPRDIFVAEARGGGEHFEVSGEFVSTDPPLSLEDPSRQNLFNLRTGRVEALVAFGGSAIVLNTTPDRSDSESEWTVGAGTYVRLGADGGLQITGAMSLLGGGSSGDLSLVLQAEFRIPLLRHRWVHLDLVGKLWSSFGRLVTLFGIGEVRARILRRASVGVGWTGSGVALSLGVHFLR